MIQCIAIDDDPLFLQLLSSYIKEIEGVELLATYENPVDGIMQVVKKKPDILFIDIDMPYLNGWETLDSLDKRPKVIMISAHVDQPTRDKHVTIDKYLRKVRFDKAILEKAITDVTGG